MCTAFSGPPRDPFEIPLTPSACDFLCVRGLVFGWAGQPDLFHRFDVTLGAGLALLTGEEQRGKTSFLRLLAGELTPRSGSLLLAGRAISTGWAGWRPDMGGAALDPVSVDQWLHEKVPDGPARERLEGCLDGLSLGEHLHKTFHMLSAGGRRKVGLAAAMALQAPLTLLDQPFSALDLPSVRCVTEWLREQSRASDRLVLVADYGAPSDLPIAQRIDLG